MKNKTKKITKIIIVIALVVWMLPGIAKLIAMNTLKIDEGDCGISLGTIYYRKYNTSSPTSAVRLVRVKGVDARNLYCGGKIVTE